MKRLQTGGDLARSALPGRLLEKLGLRTTAELIRYAIEHLLKI